MNRKGFRDPRLDDLAPYALGALTPEERREMDALLERSAEARLELAAYEDAAAALALSLPDIEAPPGLRSRILRSADAASRQPAAPIPGAAASAPAQPPSAAARAPVSRPVWPVRITAAASGGAIAAAVALAVFFGIRTSQLQGELDEMDAALKSERAAVAHVEARMDTLTADIAAAAERSGEQQSQVSRLAAANEVLQEALKDQRWLTYVTFNRNWETTSWLRPSQEAPGAQGQFVVNPNGDTAVLFVDSMPPLPDGQHYKLWLSGTGWRWPAASFKVDEYGYARLDLALPAGVSTFTNASITREPDPGIDSLPIEVLSAPATR
jgi:anti-sigma-K factor RskA